MVQNTSENQECLIGNKITCHLRQAITSMVMRGFICYCHSFFLKPDDPNSIIKRISPNSKISYNEWLTYQLAYKEWWSKSLGGIIVILGLIMAYHRMVLSREEQMTNRFSKAVELLGEEDISVRLGTLYAFLCVCKNTCIYRSFL